MKGKILRQIIKAGTLFSILQIGFAAQMTVEVFQLNLESEKNGMSEKIGTISFEDSEKGLVLKTDLRGLPAGKHGFHIHENASCEGAEKDGKYQAGLAAGGHFDPENTGKHLGPNGKGHMGDLPVLTVNKKGEAKTKIVAPHLTVEKVEGRSIVIHKEGDNYSDKPPLGGGGDRIACAIIE